MNNLGLFSQIHLMNWNLLSPKQIGLTLILMHYVLHQMVYKNYSKISIQINLWVPIKFIRGCWNSLPQLVPRYLQSSLTNPYTLVRCPKTRGRQMLLLSLTKLTLQCRKLSSDTCIALKIMEHIVTKHRVKHLECNNWTYYTCYSMDWEQSAQPKPSFLHLSKISTKTSAT